MREKDVRLAKEEILRQRLAIEELRDKHVVLGVDDAIPNETLQWSEIVKHDPPGMERRNDGPC